MIQLKSTRRRGDDLLENLYNATIKLTSTVNINSLTFQQIASAANTSRTVLYRRWKNTFDLLQDIYLFKSQKLFDAHFLNELKDNGSLRSDFIQLLTIYQKVYEETGSEIINGYYYLRSQDQDAAKKPAAHKEAREKYVNAIKKILHHAQLRGEHIKNASPITYMLPFDLIRIENLIRPGNIHKKRLATLVDEILLPTFCYIKPVKLSQKKVIR